MTILNSEHSQLLAKAMDSYTLRQRITASNIANIDTPGYTRHEVNFEEALREAQEGNMRKAEVNPSITETSDKVVLEDELIEMADTQMRAQLVARSLRHHYNMVRTGIASTVR